MAYFEPYIDSEGIHIPTYADIMSYLTERYRAIFGQDSYLGEETPDYQLLSVFAKCIDDYAALATECYNSRNPYYAVGNSLDILVEFAGLIRYPATYSTAVLKLSGDEGTEIPTGKKVIDKNGYLWTTQSAVTIPAAGYITVNSICDTAGSVIAPTGTISGIYTPLAGWTGVTNESDAIIGRNVETDAELRNRFSASHASSDSGTLEALKRGLLGISGVQFAKIVQNDTGTTDANGIPGHSICSIVEGGDADEIARKIMNAKAPGVGTHGSVTKTVSDGSGGTMTIKFSRPSDATVSVDIELRALSGYDADRVSEKIKNAIAADINSLGIGESWNVTMAYRDIYSAFAGEDIPFVITSLSATKGSGSPVTDVVQCAYNEILTTDASDITITLEE